MLMDEPFGAIDPIIASGCRTSSCASRSEVGKTIVFVTHDIDEAIKIGDRIAVLRRGGKLAQYATPADLLVHPADDFVADFVGADRALKRLALHTVAEMELGPPSDGPRVARTTTCRDALALMIEKRVDRLAVTDDGGTVVGSITREVLVP